MDFEVGGIYEGKVTGITGFGAFVLLGPGKTGLVHISEVSNAYVEDINKFLTVGQKVKVKVISIDQAGRINLSVKKAADPEQQQAPRKDMPPRASQSRAPQPQRQDGRQAPPPPPPVKAPAPKSADESFEEKLKQFMQSSERRMSDIKNQAEKKIGRRRR